MSQFDGPAIERLLAHEAGHVLLYQRGEHASRYQHLVNNETDWHLLCIASYAIEEYRIERGLLGFGYPPAEATTTGHLANALAELNYQVIVAVMPGTAVEHMRAAVLSAQDVFTKVLADTAAADTAGTALNSGLLHGHAGAHWTDYLGESWTRRTALYGSLPDAWTAIADSQWASVLADGIAIERALLSPLGFAYEVVGDSTYFTRAGSDALFNARVDRARLDFPE